MLARKIVPVILILVVVCVGLIMGVRTQAMVSEDATGAYTAQEQTRDVQTEAVAGNGWGVMPTGSNAGNQPNYKPGEIIVKFKKPVADAMEQQLADKTPSKNLKLTKSLDNLNSKHKVKSIEPMFKNFKSNREQMKNLLKKDANLLSSDEKRILRRQQRAPKDAKVPELDRIYMVKLEAGQSAEQAVADYSKEPVVEYAELNYKISLYLTPDDSNYPIQWPLNNTGDQNYPLGAYYPGQRQPPGTLGCDINAPKGWDITTGSQEVVVAVLDTGIDYNHRDLVLNMWADANGDCGRDFADDDNDPMDYYGHGTHCAGTIAAVTNNNLDVAGVSWNAKIMSVKIFPNYDDSAFISIAVAGIEYAVDNGADILSNSWGGGGYSQALGDAIEAAYQAGAIIVAAAGNGDSGLSEPSYPASYDHVISVAATDSNDDRCGFSYYGSLVDIAAPGGDILSLKASVYTGSYQYGDTMLVDSGTSMACPHVAGACALLLSVNAPLSSDDANGILRSTAHILADSNICASGRLDVGKAILGAVSPKGYINLDRPYYGYDVNINILVSDLNLAESNFCDVNLTCGGDSNVVTLYAISPGVGIFTGSISTGSGDPEVNDGILQIADGQTITGTYYDADYGIGNSAVVNDTATADCVEPVISDVNFTKFVTGNAQVVTFDTNELTTARIVYGTSCEEANMAVEGRLCKNHTVTIDGLEPNTWYYFTIEATDQAGNTTIDSNDDNCYAWRNIRYISVPADYSTVQGAINAAVDGDVITLSQQNTYHENLNLNGKSVTVQGADLNDFDRVATTVIHGNGTANVVETDSGAVLKGLTIAGGGRGVYCTGNSLVISNAIVRSNGSEGIYADSATVTIKNSFIYDNNEGITLQNTEGTVQNNTIVDNTTFGIRVIGGNGPSISNCIIWNNSDELYNCSATYSCIKDVNDASGIGNITTDPCFVYAGINDFHLNPMSVCVDAGDPNGSYNDQIDIDGDARVLGLHVDMGADEAYRVHNVDQDIWYSNIQDAVAASRVATQYDIPGDEIVVYPGTYKESVAFYNDVQYGYCGADCIVRSMDPDNWDVVASTVIEGTEIDALYFGHATTAQLSGFTVTNKSYGIYTTEGSTSAISNCIIKDCMKGIWVGVGSAPSVTKCIIRDNTSEGIYLTEAGIMLTKPIEVCLSDNLIFGNDIGIRFNVPPTQYPMVKNNTIVNNTSYGIRTEYSINLIITDCILWNNGDELYGCGAAYSCIKDCNDANGTGNICGDANNPDFIDAESNGCHIDVNSPCFDAGNPANSFADQGDIDGDQRVQGWSVDIGADEVRRVFNDTTGVWCGGVQSAIDAASANDVIVIYPGIYYEAFKFNGKAVTVRSVDPNNWDEVNDVILMAMIRVESGEGSGSILKGLHFASSGTGIQCSGASPTISRCMMSGERGVVCNGGSPTIENCRIFDTSSYGIVVANVTNALITGNEIYNAKQGIYCVSNATATITNNTIVGSTKYGIYNSTGCTSTISNCIIWDNNDELHNCTATYSCIKDCNDASGTGNICGDGNDPCFVKIDDNDFHLAMFSLCIDAGEPNGDYNDINDIDGEMRKFGTRVDIGADEAYWPNGHWWKLDEVNGVTAYDSVDDNDGIFNGDDPCWVVGHIGGAVDLNGVSDYFAIPDVNTVYGSAKTFTIAGWFKTSQSTGIQTIVGSWVQWTSWLYANYYQSHYSGWQVLVENNKVKVRFATGSPTTPYDITGTKDVNDCNWHHFVLVHPGYGPPTNSVLYVDGQQDATPTGYACGGTGPFRIGDGSYAVPYNGVYPTLKGGPFCGMIDDVMIFNRALTADEVEQLYEAGQ